MAAGDSSVWGCPSGVGDLWKVYAARQPAPSSGFLAPNLNPPPAGTLKLAILLVQFQDTKFSGDTTQVSDSVGSMLGRIDTYYRAVSYNKMVLSYTIFDTLLVTASQNQSAYSGSTANQQSLVTEVLGRVDTFVNFGAYDALMVLHAGVSNQLTGVSTDLSAQFFDDLPAFTDTQTNDTVTHCILAAAFGKVVNGQPVTMLGTLAHEFGHVLGLPDLYNTATGAGGIGDWGLMGTGNYHGSPQGDSPAWMSAWSREYFGWADTVVIDTTQSVSITKAESDSRIYKIRVSPVVDTEYFLLEVREPANYGLDSAPGSGLLIWHIDNNMGSLSSNNIQNVSVLPHRRIDLEEADGSDVGSAATSSPGTSNQPWPGGQGRTVFADNTAPSSRGYTDTIARFKITDIVQTSGVSLTVNFDTVSVQNTWYVNDTYSSATDSFTTAGGSDTSYGDGSRTRPFRSVARAMQSAKSWDTIYVDAGLYGDTYVSVSSTETAAFKIDTDYITIIGVDSGATVIDPPGDSGITTMYGIYADTQVGLTIKNFGVTGAYNGIYFVNVDSSVISGDSVAYNGNAGIYLINGSDTNTIQNSVVSFNSVNGVDLSSSFGCTVLNNVVDSNLGTGINLQAANGNRVESNTVQGNAGNGISVTQAAWNLVTGNVTQMNTTNGISLPLSTDNVVKDNIVRDNAFNGIDLPSGSDRNVLIRNLVRGSALSGILIDGDTNIVMMNEIAWNDTGIQVTASGGGNAIGILITKNNIHSNTTNNLYNPTGETQTLIRNWWGTKQETEIDTDIDDTPSAFIPYRLGAVDTTPGGDTTAPSKPLTVGIDTGTAGRIDLTWTIPTIDEETNGGSVGFAGVKVYRLTNQPDTTHWGNSANHVWTSGASDTTWNDTQVTAGSTYYYRLSSFDGSSFVNQSFFTDTVYGAAQSTTDTSPRAWYVNDTYTASDSFTYAGGSDTSYGDGTPSKPFRSAARAMQSVRSGDTVYVDAGLYGDTYVEVAAGSETAAFKIDTDYVTIIGKDSNATVIDPPGPISEEGLYGIHADTQTGLVIRNLGVTGAFGGIVFSNVVSSTISGDSLCFNDVAVYLTNGSNSNTVTGVTACNNSIGIYLDSGSSNTITNNQTDSNSNFGIMADSSTYNTISGNTTDSNAVGGIYLNTSWNNTVETNTARFNASMGIYLASASKNTLRGNIADSNVDYGFYFTTSDTNTLTNNTAHTNAVFGIRLISSSFNAITVNAADSNASAGISIDTGTFNIVAGNRFSGDSQGNQAGVLLAASDSNIILQNDLVTNVYGLLLNGSSSNNTITRNNFIANGSHHALNQSGLAQTFTRNWWDTTDEVTISEKFGDTVSLFIPYRLGRVDTVPGADTTAPAPPVGVGISADTIGQITLTWTIPTVNEETNGGSVGYAGAKIHRLTNQKDTTNWANGANLVWTASSAATSWTDTTVSVGKTYYYRLTSFDASSIVNQSFFTDTVSASPTRNIWYVNDTYTAADSFTYSGGSDTGYGDGSQSKPFRSVARVMQIIKSGDTVYVDAGLYSETYVEIVAGSETAAFEIDTDYITIIGKDSNATVFDPPGSSTSSGLYGIYADTQIYLTIKDLGVTGAYDGIHFYNVDRSTITGDSASSNGSAGVYLSVGSDTNTITSNTVDVNTYGIYLYSNFNNRVSGNFYTVASNGYGIYLDNSDSILVDANTFNLPDGANARAINLLTSTGNTISSNYFLGPGSWSPTNFNGAIFLDSSANNVIRGHTTASQSLHAFLVLKYSDSNIISYNDARGFSDSFFYMEFSNYNQFQGNNAATSDGNLSHGFMLISSSHNSLTGCTAIAVKGSGIYLTSADSNLISNCFSQLNGWQSEISSGIYLGSSHGNSILNSHVSGNRNHGIQLYMSTNNIMIQNTSDSNNLYQIYVDTGSTSNIYEKNNILPGYLHPDSGVLSNSSESNILFARCWWGTTDEMAIKIMVGGEQSTSDSIIFVPYRLSQVDTSIDADTTAPGVPANVVLDTSVAGEITLTWTIPTINEETNGGTVGYAGLKVYRLKNQPDTSNWGNSANLVWVAGAADTSWTDTTVAGGNTYYYRLSSLDGSSIVNQSFFTDTVWDTVTVEGTVKIFEDGSFTDQVDTLLTRDILFLQVTDTDENAAGGTAETVSVTVYVGNGTTEFDAAGLVIDTETFTLTESGANTAIFRSDTIVVMDTKVPVIGDGILSWGRMDTLHVVYVDNDDTSDVDEDTALAVEIATTVQSSASGAVEFIFDDPSFIDLTDTFSTRDFLYIQVSDTDENRNPQSKDTISVTVTIGLDGSGLIADTEVVILTESGEATGTFRSGAIILTDTAAYAANDGFLTWATSDTLTVEYIDVTGGTTDSGFDTALLVDTEIQANTGPNWYVNDTSTTGDVYTTAAGSDTAGAGTPTSPYRTIVFALSKVKSGDTIYVDRGEYDSYMVISSTETAALVIDTDDLAIIGVDSSATNISPPGDSTISTMHGIYADTVSGLSIRQLGVFGAYNGIKWVGVTRSRIEAVEVDDNANEGIVLRESSDTNTLVGNSVHDNVDGGISIKSSRNNAITGNLIHTNIRSGLAFTERARQNIAIFNTISGNQNAGIQMEDAESNVISLNQISSNDTGVNITLASYGNVFTKNNFFGSNVNDVFSESARDTGLAQFFTRNYWGTTDEDAIDTDFADTASEFIPYRLNEVDTTPGGDSTAPAPPTGVALDTGIGARITVTWTIPTINEETNGGTVGYAGLKVYRLKNTPDTTNWANPANLVWIAGSSDVSWSDTGVSGGETYYYRLASFDGSALFNRSFFTDTVYVMADSLWAGPEWYVNDTYTSADSFTYAGGSDTEYGDGSRTKPFRSPARAMQAVESGETVYIDAGLYSETYVVAVVDDTAAFKIGADFVTVIGKDSNATVIDPPGLSTTIGVYGIYAINRTGLVIQNLGVTGAYNGVGFNNVDASTIIGDSFSGNFTGLALGNNSDSNLIRFNRTDHNTLTGIDINSCTYNTVADNISSGNGSAALSLAFAGSNLVTRNLLSNSNYGVYLQGSHSNSIVQNEVSGDTRGVYITWSSTANEIVKNNITAADSFIVNESDTLQTFSRNWYGTTDEVAVQSVITDTYQIVDIRPYRLGVVDTSAGADTTAPTAPLSVGIDTGTAGQIDLTWAIPTINEETNGGSVGYAGAKIYRLTNQTDTAHWANSANLVWTASSTATSWSDTQVTAGSTYYYRLTSFDGSSIVNQSFFTDTVWGMAQSATTGTGTIWYVNDTYVSGSDSFTYAGGADTSGGDGSAGAPFRSVARAMQSAKSGGTIYVDAGLYVETYVIISSSETAAFKIDTDYITIIGKDSNATVIGLPGSSNNPGWSGIYANSRSGIVVQHLGIIGVYDGIQFIDVTNSLIESDSISSCGNDGIRLLEVSSSSSGNIIRNNHVSWNSGQGLHMQLSSDDTISGNVVNFNSLGGIYLFLSSRTILIDNTFDSNSFAGIFIYLGSDNKLLNNVANWNLGSGIHLKTSSDNVLRGNTANWNDSYGLHVASYSTILQLSIFQNDFRNNREYQIYLDTNAWVNAVVKNNMYPSSINPAGGVFNNTNNAADFARNWWGTTDESLIEGMIADTEVPKWVSFYPYRLGPVDTAAGADTTAPAPPVNVGIDTGVAGQIDLTWTIPTVNEETNGGTVGYAGAKIYRLTNQTDTTHWASSANLVWTASSTATSWSDTTVTAGSTYYYRLTSFDASAIVNQSFFTDTVWGTAQSAASTAGGVDSLVIYSGDHQLDESSDPSVPLANPLVARVTDSAGAGIAYVPVTFSVVYPSGGASAYFDSVAGHTSETTTLSDTNGLASVTFTTGTAGGIYRVEISTDSNTSLGDVFDVYYDGVDVSSLVWKMVTPNKAVSSATFGSVIADDLTDAVGFAWKEDAGVSAGLSEYTELSSGSSIERGRSYWVLSSGGGDLRIQGTAGFDTVQVALTAGWHMIGSGQYFWIDWDSGVKFDTNGTLYYPAQADAKGIIDNVIYWYNGAGYYWGPDPATPALSRVQLKPMTGFWLLTPVACTMTVYPNPASPADTATQILQQAPGYWEGEREKGREGESQGQPLLQMAAKYSQGGDEADWLIRLTAAAGGQSDFQNYVGVKPTPAAATHASVYDPPAAAGKYVSVGIVDGSGPRLAASYVEPITTAKEWNVTVASNLDTPVTLSWDNLASVPEKYGAFLIGGPQGVVDLRKKSSVTLSLSPSLPLSLSVVVGLPEYLGAFLAPSLDKTQTFVYPNPGPDGTTGAMTFKYNLQSAADVTLRIFDVGGKYVKELKQSGVAGSNTMLWDTTNRYGQRLGSGVYIYILQSGSTRLVDKLAIVR
ncbi:right-handed parallel beta-helix repeat-containing protein [bacterium]|nr:right-handed parallel beta-helix repeat-containing protein [bacterium]